MIKRIYFCKFASEKEQVAGVEVGLVLERVQGVLHIVQFVLQGTEGLGHLGREGGREGGRVIQRPWGWRSVLSLSVSRACCMSSSLF